MKIRCLLSTVLVVSSTDTEMLFSVAGFQTSTVKRKLYILCAYIIIYGVWDLEL